MRTRWLFGGVGDYFPHLTWGNRPDMSNTGAPEVLQDAWVATVLAVQESDLASEIEAMLPPATLCPDDGEGANLVGDGASWALAVDDMASRMPGSE